MPFIDEEIRAGAFVLAIHLPDVASGDDVLNVEVGLARPEGCEAPCPLEVDGDSVLADQPVVRDEIRLDAMATRSGDRITVRIARAELPGSAFDDDERILGQHLAVEGLTLSFDIGAAQQETVAGGAVTLSELERFYMAFDVDEATFDAYVVPQLDLGATACEAMSIGFRVEVTRVINATDGP